MVTLNNPGRPAVNVVMFALVMLGGPLTVSVKLWLVAGAAPLFAVMVIGKVPPTVGVPASVAVPLPLSWNVTPAGSAPVSVSAGVGKPPEVVTVNVPAWPTVKVVWSALVITGEDDTVRVNAWSVWPTVLVAVSVSG